MITAFILWLHAHYKIEGTFTYGMFFVIEMVTYVCIAALL